MHQQGKADVGEDEEIRQELVYLKDLEHQSAMSSDRVLDKNSTHRTPNDENPFFLFPSPLNNLVRTLSERVSARVRTGDAVHFKQRRYPGEGDGVAADAVLDF